MNTVKKETYIEFEIKKSKFIGYIKPVNTCEEAVKFIESIKDKHKDATHNVSAYRLIENKQEYFKYSDDGEPKDTAGKPIAEIMNYQDIYNAVIVVTRYFGGIKLGAGGLIRNYGKAAKLVIEESEIIQYIEKQIKIIDFDYSKIGEIDKILQEREIEIVDKIFENRVTYKINVSQKDVEIITNVSGIILI